MVLAFLSDPVAECRRVIASVIYWGTESLGDRVSAWQNRTLNYSSVLRTVAEASLRAKGSVFFWLCFVHKYANWVNDHWRWWGWLRGRQNICMRSMLFRVWWGSFQAQGRVCVETWDWNRGWRGMKGEAHVSQEWYVDMCRHSKNSGYGAKGCVKVRSIDL